MRFEYSAYDRQGRASQGVLDAVSREDADEQLRRRGLFVANLKETSGGGEARSGRAGGSGGSSVLAGSGWGGPSTGRRLAAIAGFSRQMSVLVSTGTPVVDAMRALERQTPEGVWRGVLADVCRRVEQGDTLSRAMEAHAGWFDPVARSLIAAGEGGGRLPVMLDRLGKLTRQQLKVRGTVIGAMVYPCLLIVVALSVLTSMIGFVLPRFEGLFTMLGATLPPSTRMLMDISAFIREWWWAVLGGLVAAAVGAWVWLRTEEGRELRDRIILGMPQVGRLTMSLTVARIARVLGVLLEGKVGLLESLRLTQAAAGNSVYRSLLMRAEESVLRGDTMSAVLVGSPLIEPAVAEAFRSAERSGQIAPVLLSVAEAMDEDNEVAVRTMTGLIEPVILIALGVVVGMVALAMFLPLFDLTAAAGPGGGG